MKKRKIFDIEESKETKKTKKIEFDEKLIQAKKELEEKGYTVIEDIIPEKDCLKFHNQYKQFLIDIQNNDDPSEDKIFSNFGLNHQQNIYRSNGVGQLKTSWEIRQLVKPIFESLYGTNDLLTSMCGFCYMNPKGSKFKTLYHTDLSSELNKKEGLEDFVCYQGIVNLVDNGYENGGLVVFEGSHKKHSQFYEENNIKTEDNFYIYYNEEDKNKESSIGKKYLDQFKRVKVNMKAGSVALVDSRTAHAITPNKKGKRNVTYVCQLPTSLATNEEIEKRFKIWKKKITTSHWPCIKIKENSLKTQYRPDTGFHVDSDEWKEKFNFELNYEQKCLLVGNNNINKFF